MTGRRQFLKSVAVLAGLGVLPPVPPTRPPLSEGLVFAALHKVGCSDGLPMDWCVMNGWQGGISYWLWDGEKLSPEKPGPHQFAGEWRHLSYRQMEYT